MALPLDPSRSPRALPYAYGDLVLAETTLLDRWRDKGAFRTTQRESRVDYADIRAVRARQIIQHPALEIILTVGNWDGNWGHSKSFAKCDSIDDVRAFAAAIMIRSPQAMFEDAYETDRQGNDERSQAASSGPMVQVKNYKDAKAYERDAAAMASMGWLPQGQIGQRGKVKVGSTAVKAAVFLPWALMRPARKGDPITVTWVREPKPEVAKPPPAYAPAPPMDLELAAKLRQLADLRDQGLISEADFEGKKADLLGRM